MQADWEIEIGGDAPVIDACWAGFVDLRQFPNQAGELAEVQTFPALGDALISLNAEHSPVWTAKCDVWIVDEVDRFEVDAPPEAAAHATACYVDLLPRSDQQWRFPARAIASCKQLCANLHGVPLRCCRADLVIRCALIAPEVSELGVTAYLTACGTSEHAARLQLELALAAFVDAVVCEAPPAQAHS